MCLGKNHMMPVFCKWPSPGLNKQSVEKIIRLTFLPDPATQRQVINSFYHHEFAKILLTSMC